MSESPFILMKQLEADVLRRLSYIDIADLETRQQHTLLQLKNGMIDARLDIQDYELAETRDDQLRNAADAKQRLKSVLDTISLNSLQAFSAVDVAHLSAQIGQITARLK